MNDATDDRLFGMTERVTRLETLLQSHEKDSHHFREATDARLTQMGNDIRTISSKLDVISNKITVAETQVKTSAGIVGWVLQHIPSLSVGGVLAWLAAQFWHGKS